jgi:hypothetical protein
MQQKLWRSSLFLKALVGRRVGRPEEERGGCGGSEKMDGEFEF